MKRNNFITLFILFALSFSMSHEFIIAKIDTNKCSVNEYIQEINAPISHGDICDIHFEFHQVFLLPQPQIMIAKKDLTASPIQRQNAYKFTANLDFSKPPIV